MKNLDSKMLSGIITESKELSNIVVMFQKISKNPTLCKTPIAVPHEVIADLLSTVKEGNHDITVRN